MDLSQLAMLLDLSFQYLLLHLLISLCTQLYHMFVVVLLVDFSEDYFWIFGHFPFTLHSIYTINQIQLTYSAKWKYIPISEKMQQFFITSLSPFTLIPQNILLKTFHSKAASCSAISLFNVQDSALFVATGLIKVSHIFIVSALSTDWLYGTGRSASFSNRWFQLMFLLEFCQGVFSLSLFKNYMYHVVHIHFHCEVFVILLI